MRNNNNDNNDLENLSSEDIKELFNEIIEMPEDERIFIAMCSKSCPGSCWMGDHGETM